MKDLPRDPLAFRERVFGALCDDIVDRASKGSPRVDALREISKQRDAGK